MDHTFVVPVYRGAPGLSALIESLRAQVGPKSEILLSTSTPSAELDAAARRHAVKLHVNPQRLDISADWNFALTAAATRFVTLAHQDDLFESSYVARLRAALCENPD